REHLFQGMPGLARAITRRDCAVDLRCPVAVEAVRKFGTRSGFHRDQCRKRHRVPVAITDTEEADVIGLRTKISLGFDVDLPDATEAGEVIDEEASDERLEGLVNQTEVYTFVQHLVAVDIRINLRRVRDECRSQRGKLGPLACSLKEPVHVLREKIDSLAGAVFEHKRY